MLWFSGVSWGMSDYCDQVSVLNVPSGPVNTVVDLVKRVVHADSVEALLIECRARAHRTVTVSVCPSSRWQTAWT